MQGQPGKCGGGCACCVYANGNSRCLDPRSCAGVVTCPPGQVLDPVAGCVAPPTTTTTTTTVRPTTVAPTTTTVAPTTTTTRPTTTAAPTTTTVRPTTTAAPTSTTVAPSTTTVRPTTTSTTPGPATTTTTARPTTTTARPTTTTSTPTTTTTGAPCTSSATCGPNQTCAYPGIGAAFNSSLPKACCPANGVLCDVVGADFDLCCPAGDTCSTQTVGTSTIPRCSSQGDFCPTLNGQSSVTCAAGERCAITEFDPTNIIYGGSPAIQTGCCPAGGVICSFGSTSSPLGPIDLCCPAGDTCETQTIGRDTFPRCSSANIICTAFTGNSYPCTGNQTCAILSINPIDPEESVPGCCPADGVLCTIGTGPNKLCCPAGDTCTSQTFGTTTYPSCSSQGEFCPTLSGSGGSYCDAGEPCGIASISDLDLGCCPAGSITCAFPTSGTPFPFKIGLCCPAGDMCLTQSFGTSSFPRCSSRGEYCSSSGGGSSFISCELGETCAVTAIVTTDPLNFETGCCAAGSKLCAAPTGSSFPAPLCCPATSTCGTVGTGSTSYPQCVS